MSGSISKSPDISSIANATKIGLNNFQDPEHENEHESENIPLLNSHDNEEYYGLKHNENNSNSVNIHKSPSTSAIAFKPKLNTYQSLSSYPTSPTPTPTPPYSNESNRYKNKRPSTSGNFDDDLESHIALKSNRHHSVSAIDLFRIHPSSTLPPQKHFLQRLVTNKFLVTNPNLPFDLHNANTSLLNLDNKSTNSATLEEQQRRFDIINSLRPQKLIGTYKKLANWMDSYIEETDKVKKKSLRKYYQDQNYLIERFSEIDSFLDAGQMHYKMLSTYGDDIDPDTPIGPLDHPIQVNERNMNTKKNNDNNDDIQTESTPMFNINNGKNYKSIELTNDTSYNSTNSSRKPRFYDIPGNINEGGQFLGYDEEKDNKDILVAILVNFFINFILLVGKIIVSILTNSLSVVASLIDSILDFLSTFIIYITNRLTVTKNWKSQHSYPIGRSRLEPLGILVFSIIIIISFFQVGQESFKRLFFSDTNDRAVVIIGFDAIIIMTLTIVSKVCCWVWCNNSNSSSVQALAQDAMTDIIFNIVSLLMPTFGNVFEIWWLDPLGALLLSCFVIFSWSKTAFEHIDNLTGAVADPLDYKVILYLAYRFAESIKQITSLKVYHVGDNLNVEIDVVFNIKELDLTFKDCHDIAEALQYSIESLPTVERAFVHIDYMEGNFKGHLN